MPEVPLSAEASVLLAGLAGGVLWFLRGRVASLMYLIAQRLTSPNHSFNEVSGIVSVVLYGLVMVAVFSVFAPIAGIGWIETWTAGLTPSLVLAGLALGIGEACLSILLATCGLRLAYGLRHAQIGEEVAFEYRLIGQTGWMRGYTTSLRSFPKPIAYGAIALALIGEELFFRGFLIPVLEPLGPTATVILSTLAFMAIQAPDLPSWYQAIPPLCGALVVGLVHGTLFVMVPCLTPLVLSHFVFFVILLI